MTILETAVVSRKTPRDGKLEISAGTAAILGRMSAAVEIELGGVRDMGSVVSMPCACKGETSHVVHHFLQAELLRSLRPDSSVIVRLADRGPVTAVTISRVES